MSGIDRFEMTEEERTEARKLIGQLDAALRREDAKEKERIETMKRAILDDDEFIESLAKRLGKYL